MMSLWDALRMNMMISYQELVRTFPRIIGSAARRMKELTAVGW
ncbi:ydjO [Escherichia coli]|nr:ydjO [Escherichia coli]